MVSKWSCLLVALGFCACGGLEEVDKVSQYGAEMTEPFSEDVPQSGACPALDLPSSFRMRETGWSIVAGAGFTAFELQDSSGAIGRVEQEVFSFTRKFKFTNQYGALLATARQKIFSWGVEIEIFDCTNTKIGTLREEIFQSLFKVHTVYQLLDAQGTTIARSEKVDWISTRFRLTDTQGQTAMEMERPMFNWFGDSWKVTIYSQANIDPRLYVMMGAFKTAVDKERRAAAAASSANDTPSDGSSDSD